MKATHPKPIVVRFTATRSDSWVQVRAGSSTGRVLFQSLVRTGQSFRVRGSRLWARFGSLGNIDLSINGRAIHPALNGTVDAVITASGLQVAPPQTSAAAAPATAAAKTKRTADTGDDLWHRGLQAWPDPAKHRLPDIYYKWLHSNFSCAVYASFGCWKAKVVTRHGCPRGFNILVDETQDGAKVGVAIRFIARIVAKTPRIVEVDADRAHVDGRVASMSCN
jgi:Domain of unknown function (DUF4115)